MSHSIHISACELLNKCFNNPDIPQNYMCERRDELLQLIGLFEKEACPEIDYVISKKSYQRHEYLRKANALTQCLWLIRSGAVAEVFLSEKNEIIIEIHFPGEFIGNYANYRMGHTNEIALKALTKVKCWEIPCSKIAEWHKRYNSVRMIAEILTENSLFWHKNVLDILKSIPPDEAVQYLHNHFPQYQRLFSREILASFLSISVSTLDRNKAN